MKRRVHLVQLGVVALLVHPQHGSGVLGSGTLQLHNTDSLYSGDGEGGNRGHVVVLEVQVQVWKIRFEIGSCTNLRGSTFCMVTARNQQLSLTVINGRIHPLELSGYSHL